MVLGYKTGRPSSYVCWINVIFFKPEAWLLQKSSISAECIAVQNLLRHSTSVFLEERGSLYIHFLLTVHTVLIAEGNI